MAIENQENNSWHSFQTQNWRQPNSNHPNSLEFKWIKPNAGQSSRGKTAIHSNPLTSAHRHSTVFFLFFFVFLIPLLKSLYVLSGRVKSPKKSWICWANTALPFILLIRSTITQYLAQQTQLFFWETWRVPGYLSIWLKIWKKKKKKQETK